MSCSTMPVQLLHAPLRCLSTLSLQQIEGWEKAILGTEDIPPVREGGRRTVQIPASLAYGQRGLRCLFGRNSTCRQAVWLKLGCMMTGSSQFSFQSRAPPDTAVEISFQYLGLFCRVSPSLPCGVQ